MRRNKMVALVLLAAILLGSYTLGFAAVLKPWVATGQLLPDKTKATVKFAVIDSDGKLVSGLKKTNFTLFSAADGNNPPGKYTFTVTEDGTVAGIYSMVIQPGTGTKWNSKFVVFQFLTKSGGTNSVGQVTVANVNELWPSGAALSAEEKEGMLNMLPLQ
jgi:hypothetical protein